MSIPPTTCFNTAQTSYMRTAAEPYAPSTSHAFRGEASLMSQSGQTATNGNATSSHHPHHAAAESMGRLETAYGTNTTWLPDQMTAGSGGDTYMGAIGDLQASDNFASWLFDSPGSQQQEFNLTNLPFLDFGLDYSPSELWNFEHNAASFGSVATPSLQTPSDTATDQLVDARRAQRAIRMSESRREHLVSIIVGFLRKRRTPSIHIQAAPESVLFIDERQSLPNLTTDVFEYLLKAYWRDVTKQMPILHQPTFDCDECEDLLLLALIMLGASQVVRSNSKGTLTDYRDLADLLASHLRWEIFTEDDAQPPVQLWVAQALLLIEIYTVLDDCMSERTYITLPPSHFCGEEVHLLVIPEMIRRRASILQDVPLQLEMRNQ
ncbi:hypothetical protein D0867_02131 [Hortaea werneckii]|uniref:Xylanolytic transcriptional activator regulatory domain-containing protein n=1 Tax=Hortaea werneckii TaxID=91943 RepID=A0A3M7A7T2_HORWE|nr:hypothetical protein D0867_02131 [Hortaea werneckii]